MSPPPQQPNEGNQPPPAAAVPRKSTFLKYPHLYQILQLEQCDDQPLPPYVPVPLQQSPSKPRLMVFKKRVSKSVHSSLELKPNIINEKYRP